MLDPQPGRRLYADREILHNPVAFSSEADTGSREENATKQGNNACLDQVVDPELAIGTKRLRRVDFLAVLLGRGGLARLHAAGRRLERAAAMLGDGTASLAEVAYATGFVDQAHLSHAFRDAFRATPSRWRQEVARIQDGGASASQSG